MEVSIQLKDKSAGNNILATATVKFRVGSEPGDVLDVPGFLVLEGKPGKPPFCAEPVKTWEKKNGEKVRESVLEMSASVKGQVKKKIMDSYFLQRPQPAGK